MKDFKIQIPEGYTIDTENSNITEGIIKFKKVSSILNWEDFINNGRLISLTTMEQFYIKENEGKTLFRTGGKLDTLKNYKEFEKPIFANTKEAISITALIKLMLVRSMYIGDWKPNWNDYEEDKYAIENKRGKLYIDTHYTYRNMLSFPTKEMAELFLKNNRELIEKYYSF